MYVSRNRWTLLLQVGSKVVEATFSDQLWRLLLLLFGVSVSVVFVVVVVAARKYLKSRL